ncbi:MAG: hypothetical protein EBR09_05925 [Proteobacteria bacterium]|nr:hypothetical protein [Pseudomonadota bacterium]
MIAGRPLHESCQLNSAIISRKKTDRRADFQPNWSNFWPVFSQRPKIIRQESLKFRQKGLGTGRA